MQRNSHERLLSWDETSSAHASAHQQAFSDIKREIAISIDHLTRAVVKQRNMDLKINSASVTEAPYSFLGSIVGFFRTVKNDAKATRLSVDLDVLLKLFKAETYEDLLAKNTEILHSSKERLLLTESRADLLKKIQKK